MLNASYQDDFKLFAERGGIGAVFNIEVPTDTPEIGSVCPVTFHTCGMMASASIDGQRHFGVSDGEVIRVRMHEDRPYRVQLFTEGEAEAAAITLTPWVAEPVVTNLSLPASTTYAESLLSASVISRETEDIRVLYRVEDEPDEHWHAAHLEHGGHLTLPIAEYPHSIIVRIELASRHVAYAARARKVVEQRIVIDHPEPFWWVNENQPVYRLETAQLPLHFKWVRSAQIRYNGHNSQAQLHGGLHHTTVDFVTSEIGVQQIPVELTDLAGVKRLISIAIEVLPRRFAMSVVAQADNAIEITIAGGNQPRLSVPTRSVEIGLPDTGGVISHGFLLPTQALIVVLDDQGEERKAQLLLAPPQHQWQQLPSFSQLSAWRI